MRYLIRYEAASDVLTFMLAPSLAVAPPVTPTVLEGRHVVEHDRDGRVVGLEIRGPSRGVVLDELPLAPLVEDTLRRLRGQHGWR